MRYHIVLATLLVCILAPVAAHAQDQAPALRVVEVTREALVVELVCPENAALALAATIDGAPRDLIVQPAAAEPAALALVIETTPAMGEAGTPHSSRLRDAVTRATALLDRAPPGSQVGLVAFDRTARVVQPLSTDSLAARRALGTLLTAPYAPDGSSPGYALDQGLRRGTELLAAAPPGPRVLVVFAAGPAGELDPATLRAPIDAGLSLAIVELGGPAGAENALARAASELGAVYLSYRADESAALPTQAASVDQGLGALLAAPLRLQVAREALAPGAHQLTITGCGAPLTTSFETAVARHSVGGWPASLGVAVLVAGGALLAWRRRATRAATSSSGASTARYRAPGAVTTARGPRQGAVPALELVVWDGRERRVQPLRDRQISLGRDPGCDICIASEWVSALHARISVVDQGIEITDLGSTNGTTVGEPGRILTPDLPEPLEPGEIVRIGPEVRLSVQVAAQASAGATP